MHPARLRLQSDEVFHFIAYTAANGAVWELDGLKPGPVRVGAVPSSSSASAASAASAGAADASGAPAGGAGTTATPAGAWTAVAVPEISRRIEEYSSSEIRFNLLALVRDKRTVLAEQLQRTAARAEAAFAVAESIEPGALAGIGPDPVALAAAFEKDVPEFAGATAAPEPTGSGGAVGGAGAGMAVDAAGGVAFEPACSLDELKAQYAGLLAEGERLKAEYAAEKDKRDRWRAENGASAGLCRCVSQLAAVPVLVVNRLRRPAAAPQSKCVCRSLPLPALTRSPLSLQPPTPHLQRAAATTSCPS